MDAKADRKTGVFTVKHLHLNNNPDPKEEFLDCLRRELQAFMTFNGCSSLAINHIETYDGKTLPLSLP